MVVTRRNASSRPRRLRTHPEFGPAMLWKPLSPGSTRRYPVPMPATSTRTIYFTILARNYLAKAVALADSLRRHHPDAELVVVFIDVLRDQDLPALPDLPGVRLASTEALGLPERQVLR